MSGFLLHGFVDEAPAIDVRSSDMADKHGWML
jgi:hypothetical protein